MHKEIWMIKGLTEDKGLPKVNGLKWLNLSVETIRNAYMHPAAE